MQIALAEESPRTAVATVDVDDVKAEADRLREDDIEVGTVLELHDEVRLLDVYDPDGNRCSSCSRSSAADQARKPAGRPVPRTCSDTPSTGGRAAPKRRRSGATCRDGGAAATRRSSRLEDGFPIGAAWSRLFARDEPGFGFVDEQTPEVAIVVPSGGGEASAQSCSTH